ncbi:ERO1-like protein alpha [Oppia nitens]|uniref:ERO1-like protein alpha n=1 Tax=Oppia nitens TaxID=1686743 RepID=UPI0023DCAA5F|nr:ERO1-like protein alpha [Oppia nitens]
MPKKSPTNSMNGHNKQHNGAGNRQRRRPTTTKTTTGSSVVSLAVLTVATLAVSYGIYANIDAINELSKRTLDVDIKQYVTVGSGGGGGDNNNEDIDRRLPQQQQQRPQQVVSPPIKPKPTKTKPTVDSSIHEIRQKSTSKPVDIKSCQQMLANDIPGLTLDDFHPIDNQNPKDLTLNQISQFNNLQLGPRLQSIVRMDYFKFVKLNLNRGCTLWPDSTKCVLRDCSIQYCDKSKLPKSVIMEENNDNNNNNNNKNNVVRKVSTLTDKEAEDCPANSEQKLSQIDRTVSSTNIEAMNSLFDCTENDEEGTQYYDLLLNPERFTGYAGETCDRIWKSIYEENCFLQKQSNPFSLDNVCYEERIFYRAISGLHSSINIHLSALYHNIDGSFSHNIKEFVKRFDGQTDYIRNLYFVYLLELRALNKAEPYLLNKVNWQSSGDQSLTKEAIKDLMRTVKKFKYHFNESILFKDQPPTVAHQVGQHFHNITTTIMDCVACDRCRLWGKVQTHGLSTALKILLADDTNDKLRLHRHEITCLVNALARLSNSIAQLEVFKKLLTN